MIRYRFVSSIKISRRSVPSPPPLITALGSYWIEALLLKNRTRLLRKAAARESGERRKYQQAHISLSVSRVFREHLALQPRVGRDNTQMSDYQQDGEAAKRIASVIPYYPYKGIPRFYDINGFLTNPTIFQEVVDIFAARYRDLKVDSIGGFDARGFVLGPPIALALKVPFFMLRKPGKMPNAIASSAFTVEYGKRDGMCIPRGMPLDKDDPMNKSTVVKPGDRVVLIDDLVATGGTLSSGIELVRKLGATVVECACVVELKMFIDPPAESGLPSRTKSWKEKGMDDVPVWGLISEDVLTLKGELPEGYVDDGEEH